MPILKRKLAPPWLYMFHIGFLITLISQLIFLSFWREDVSLYLFLPLIVWIVLLLIVVLIGSIIALWLKFT